MHPHKDKWHQSCVVCTHADNSLLKSGTCTRMSACTFATMDNPFPVFGWFHFPNGQASVHACLSTYLGFISTFYNLVSSMMR